MKIKKSWFFFIPVLLISVALTLYQVLVVYNGANKSFFDGGIASIIFVSAIIVLFISLLTLSKKDSVTNGNYLISKNIPASIFMLLTSILVIIYGVLQFMNIIENSMNFLVLLNSIFSVLSGVTFGLMGFGSLTGKNTLLKSNVLVLFPTIWGVVQIFSIFMSYAAVSVHAVNMLDLVYVVFTTLFVLNVSIIYANTKSENALKSCFVYGMLSVVTVISYAVALFASQISLNGTIDIMQNTQLLPYLTLSIFTIFFLIELTKKGKTIEDAEKFNASLYEYLDTDNYIIQEEDAT